MSEMSVFQAVERQRWQIGDNFGPPKIGRPSAMIALRASHIFPVQTTPYRNTYEGESHLNVNTDWIRVSADTRIGWCTIRLNNSLIFGR